MGEPQSHEHARHRGLREIGGVGVPDTAKVDGFVFELDHRRNEGAFGKTLRLRVFHRVSQLLGEGEQLRWGEVLIPEDNNEMVEEGVVDLRDDLW